MGKQKIGRDITDRKVSIISTPKEHDEFEKWKQEQLEEQERKLKPKPILKSKLPEEKEPTPDQLARERAEIQADMARLKAEGKLKVSKVVLKEEE